MKVIGNSQVEVKVDSVVELDTGRVEKLLPSDWDKAAFRFPNLIWEWREIHAIACNVIVTGRSFQRRSGKYWVRVMLTWVGDCEPDTTSYGWMKVNPWDCPRID